MSRYTLIALIIVVIALSGAPLAAQDAEPEAGQSETASGQEQKVFKLSRGDKNSDNEFDFAEDEEAWEPGLKAGSIEVSFAFGFLGLNKTLWQHDQIIYKFTTDVTAWGDVIIKGESAFNPLLRVGYNITDWFALEGLWGISISEYTSTIENRRQRDNKPGSPVVPDPPLGEFDAERRSLITLQTSLNAVIYPLSADGRLHPYVTGGVGGMWYDMNSNYTESVASSGDLSFGGGLRLLADRNISIRLEAKMHMNKIEFTPASAFQVLNEGTTRIPINEYPIQADDSFIEQEVKSYSSQNMTLFNWSVGVHGTF